MNMRLLLYVMFAVFVTGCSTSQPRYESEAEKNLMINLDMDISSGIFSSVDVAVGINDLDNKCQSHYQGYVQLEPGPNNIGLKTGQMTYLIIEIVRSSRTNSSSFSRGTLLMPESGKQYEIDAVYKDNMYDFRLYETTGSKRERMELIPDTACMPG